MLSRPFATISIPRAGVQWKHDNKYKAIPQWRVSMVMQTTFLQSNQRWRMCFRTSDWSWLRLQLQHLKIIKEQQDLTCFYSPNFTIGHCYFTDTGLLNLLSSDVLIIATDALTTLLLIGYPELYYVSRLATTIHENFPTKCMIIHCLLDGAFFIVVKGSVSEWMTLLLKHT